ncbi:glycosyltransferase family 4 protein [Quadrisphaera setariae]|uniref:glycosyltransferase family 4 protein n=1 Tax=Quadrisphaera setariae TaxID=2593304 RepID=UPI00164FD0A5|nr:glycosyltransferase family 1 protein [Quadrisphaera setariae]
MSPASGVRRTRIGVDGHILTGKRQGTRTWLHELLLRVPHLRPDVDFVVYTSDVEELRGTYPAPNVELRALPHVPAVVRLLAFWPWAVRRDRLDALLTQYFCPPVPARRQVVVVHDVLFEDFPEFFPPRTRWRNRLLVRLSARRAAQVLTVSEYSRRAIASAYGIPAEEVCVVHNGASLPPDEVTRARDEQTPFVLSVGRLEPRKNTALLLRAFAARGSSGGRLLVVGSPDGESPEVLRALEETEGVEHLGSVSPEHLEELYRTASALVFPSLGEGWGIPVLEALAHGCPVLASDRTAIPEAGGPACTYFDPGVPGAEQVLAGLLDSALEGTLPHDPELALAQVRAHTWDASAQELAAALDRWRR